MMVYGFVTRSLCRSPAHGQLSEQTDSSSGAREEPIFAHRTKGSLSGHGRSMISQGISVFKTPTKLRYSRT